MKYFTIAELTASATAKANGIPNVPNAEQRQNMETLVAYCLDPIRAAWGHPITVTSGFRSRALNTKIGGSATSEHCKGMAADISAGSQAKNKELFAMIRAKGFAFRQLIDEKNYQWIHISYNPADLKRQVLRYNGSTYTTIATGPTARHGEQKPFDEGTGATADSKKKILIAFAALAAIALAAAMSKHFKTQKNG